MIIAVDFDGTCAEHQYPAIGPEVPGCSFWLRQWIAAGAKIILWTMRSGGELQDAVLWLTARGVLLYGVNANPTQTSWTQSPKAYAQLYVDDAAYGCPLTDSTSTPGRKMVVWHEIGPQVLAQLNGV